MKSLHLYTDERTDFTALSNAFIDNYMIKANGEYVKLYIYLLRCISENRSDLTLSSIADTFDYTEKDVKRALKYWSREKLIRLEPTENRELGAIHFLEIPANTSEPDDKSDKPGALSDAISDGSPEKAAAPDSVAPAEPKAQTGAVSSRIQALSPNRLKRLKEKKEIRQLFFIAEQYMGKTLSSSDVNSILYFYDELNFSSDLIEYLLEYCISKGHKSMHYMNSVAIAWAESSITTVSAAKEHTNLYHKNCFAVLKAFGIKNRYPAAAETAYINKWLEEDGFTLDIVVEACNRTILTINKPDFKYANGILENWKRNGVKHLSDVDALDIKHAENTHVKKNAPQRKISSADRFNNFDGREYDFDSLEKDLIEAN